MSSPQCMFWDSILTTHKGKCVCFDFAHTDSSAAAPLIEYMRNIKTSNLYWTFSEPAPQSSQWQWRDESRAQDQYDIWSNVYRKASHYVINHVRHDGKCNAKIDCLRWPDVWPLFKSGLHTWNYDRNACKYALDNWSSLKDWLRPFSYNSFSIL